MLLIYACQDILSALTELNGSHYIWLDKHYLSYVIELDYYVSIHSLSRIHLQRYVLLYNSFICQNYIEFKRTAENHLSLYIIPRSVLALDYEHTFLDLFLRSRRQLIFIPLVMRGHGCHIVICIELTQVNSEGNVLYGL